MFIWKNSDNLSIIWNNMGNVSYERLVLRCSQSVIRFLSIYIELKFIWPQTWTPLPTYRYLRTNVKVAMPMIVQISEMTVWNIMYHDSKVYARKL